MCIRDRYGTLLPRNETGNVTAYAIRLSFLAGSNIKKRNILLRNLFMKHAVVEKAYCERTRFIVNRVLIYKTELMNQIMLMLLIE